MKKIKVSEKFYSAQGEGRYIGVPSVFLRTFGCNFTCSGFGMPAGEKSSEAGAVAKEVHLYKTFEELPLVKTGCDSYPSWHPAFKHLSPSFTSSEIVDELLKLTPNNHWKQDNGNDVHLVITGGEPLLGWQMFYPQMFKDERMSDLKYVTFETNGTQKLSEKFATFLDDWAWEIAEQTADSRHLKDITFSVSPKLSASGEKWEDAIKPEIVAQYQEIGFTYLKFVVNTLEHFNEVDKAVAEYRAAGFTGPVYVMPVGGVVSVYDGNRIHVADEALKRGYFYSPRLHIDLWANGWAK